MLSDYKTVIVLDLETTGLDHRTERILEIGAVRLEGGEVVDTYETLVNPEVPIRHSSFNIHGISEEMIKDSPTIDEVMPKILEFMGDLPFVAHNAIFDYSFLNEASKRLYEKRLPNLRIDTFEMFRIVFPEEQSHGLSAMLHKFGFDPDVKHRALDDARNLALCYPQLLTLYEQQMAWQLSQITNVPYLAERYLRIQKTIQMLQAEMNDLREIFKLYFQEGGKPLLTASGELMVSSYRRNYEYNDHAIRGIIQAAGLEKQAFKINTKVVDRLIDHSDIDDDIRSALKDARVQMSENRMISFIKPTETVELKTIVETEAENGKEEAIPAKEALPD
jgi:DNA polymerase III epsilon subunit family exonuclease